MKPADFGTGVSRRTFFGLVGGAVGTGYGFHRLGDLVRRNGSVVDVVALELAMRGVTLDARGVAREVDANRDGDTDVEIGRADTETGDREDVLRITSNGTATADYGFSIANVQPRKLTLGDLAGSDTTYQYLEGDANASAVPDEVWLVLRSTESGTSGRQYVCRTETDESADAWQTREVHREITGDFGGAPDPGSGQEWKEFDRSARALTRVGDDLTERYGAEATVQGIGVGRGTPQTSPSKLDVYYDDLVVAGESTRLPG